MSRSAKILKLCLNTKDTETIGRLSLPKYETTQGSSTRQRNIVVDSELFFLHRFFLYTVSYCEDFFNLLPEYKSIG